MLNIVAENKTKLKAYSEGPIRFVDDTLQQSCCFGKGRGHFWESWGNRPYSVVLEKRMCWKQGLKNESKCY